MPAPAWAIAAEGLSKHYLLHTPPLLARRRTSAAERGHWALRDVSFHVDEGTTLGIVGRNGAGKTTLLKVLTGVTLPTEGRARMRGRVVPLLAVGAGFHPEATGRANIRLNAVFMGLTRGDVDRRMDAIVEFAEIDPQLLDLPVRLYDANTYVRLAFAAAVLLEPEVLLADEILAAGDAAFRERALEQMAEASSNQTIVFVSHDMSAVLRLSTRVLWLQEGRVAGFGEPSEVVAAYKASLPRRSRATGSRPDPGSAGALAIDAVEVAGRPLTHDRPGGVVVRWHALEGDLRVHAALTLSVADTPALRSESPAIRADEPGPRTTSVALPAGVLARSRYHAAVMLTATRPDGSPAGHAAGETWLTVSHTDRGTPSRPALAEPDLSWSVAPAPARDPAAAP